MKPPSRPRRPPVKVTDLSEIMRALGRLEEGQERQRADFDSEKEATRESRGRMHAKLERIEETVGIVGEVAAQARNEAAAVKETVENDVKPATDDFIRMRSFGKTTLWAVGIAATGLGITAATLWESAVNWLRALLRIQ